MNNMPYSLLICFFVLIKPVNASVAIKEDYLGAMKVRSEQEVAKIFPESSNPNSDLSRKMQELDDQMKKEGSPLYDSPDKLMILAVQAQKELKKEAVDSKMPISGKSTFDNKSEKIIPEMNGLRKVRIRKIEPDGISIFHEGGAKKILFEQLSEAQRKEYGLTEEDAIIYREKKRNEEIQQLRSIDHMERIKKEQANLERNNEARNSIQQKNM